MTEQTVNTELTVEQKLTMINSLEVEEDEGDGEALYYALVAFDDKTREVINQLAQDADAYIQDFLGGTDDDQTIDISPLAWESGAEWYDPRKGGFLIERPAA